MLHFYNQGVSSCIQSWEDFECFVYVGDEALLLTFVECVFLLRESSLYDFSRGFSILFV